METKDLYWLAGLLEGEGSFLANTRYLYVQCTMTDCDVIERIQALAGGYVYRYIPTNDNYKMSWIWRLNGSPARELMSILLPLMGARRRYQIETAMLIDLDRRQESEIKRAKIVENCTNAAKAYLNGEGSLRIIANRFGISQVSVLNYKRKLEQSDVTQ